jgi:hypothetical protein
MSLSSKPRKVKAKGTVRELKLVQSISRRGADLLKAEEVQTPKKKAQSINQFPCSSASIKRPRLESFAMEPIPFDVEGHDVSKKRQTLVCISSLRWKTNLDYLQGQNDYLKQFLDHEDLYLNRLLDFEIPPSDRSCTECRNPEALFRCLDCYGRRWFCQSCILKCHTQHPFHRPQQWRDGSFEKVSLSDLGYVFVLGHSSPDGRVDCLDDGNPFGDRRLTVIHVNGIFELCVRFCRCQGSSSDHEQLFSYRLFPSTFDRPETAFTMDVLDCYGIDSMECKTSAQSFFQKLRRMTNNAFPDEVPVSLPDKFNLPSM